ncbi:MAG TPA: transposase [Streptosporangiaceae bacterium]
MRRGPGGGTPRGDERLQASIGRVLALGWLSTFRQRLYSCLTGRADALFELIDAIVCADHAVTSLVELSLEPEFRRGHGALYDALAAGSIDEDALADLLVQVLPMSGPPRRALPEVRAPTRTCWPMSLLHCRPIKPARSARRV